MIFHVDNAESVIKCVEKRVHDISRRKDFKKDTKYYNYIVTCLNYLISIEKIFVLRCRAIMLHQMINNNSVSTGLILLTPTVYIYIHGAKY